MAADLASLDPAAAAATVVRRARRIAEQAFWDARTEVRVILHTPWGGQHQASISSKPLSSCCSVSGHCRS